MYKKFGRTDMETSFIVYGCMGGAGAFGSQEEKDSLEALRAAYHTGINFFDTAEMYGNGYSEQLLGRALGDVRNNIYISSKVSSENLPPVELSKACERSLKNLNTDHIDQYLLHWPNREIPLEDSVEVLKKLKQQGKIRYFGVSNFGKYDLDKIPGMNEISTNQVAYNLLFRAAEFDVLPRCRELEMPLMCYSSLMQGLLAGKYKSLQKFPDNRARTRHFDSTKRDQCRHGEKGAEKETDEALSHIWAIAKESGLSIKELAVGWLKAQNGVGGILVGTRNKRQSEFLKKLLEIDLDNECIRALTKATEGVKDALGPNIDMWDHRTK